MNMLVETKEAFSSAHALPVCSYLYVIEVLPLILYVLEINCLLWMILKVQAMKEVNVVVVCCFQFFRSEVVVWN
jgi:hypothetical protein